MKIPLVSKKMKRICSAIMTIVILAIGGCFALFYWSTNGTRTWRNVERSALSADVQDYLMIPDGASDISCWMRNGFGGEKYFECTLSRDRVDAYLEQHGWQLKQIETEFSIYSPFDGGKTRTFKAGECYVKRQQNGGGVHLVYLAESDRLFFEASAR